MIRRSNFCVGGAAARCWTGVIKSNPCRDVPRHRRLIGRKARDTVIVRGLFDSGRRRFLDWSPLCGETEICKDAIYQLRRGAVQAITSQKAVIHHTSAWAQSEAKPRMRPHRQTAGQVEERASILQGKTSRPVRFEITEGTRASLIAWHDVLEHRRAEFLWPGRLHDRPHIGTR